MVSAAINKGKHGSKRPTEAINRCKSPTGTISKGGAITEGGHITAITIAARSCGVADTIAARSCGADTITDVA